MIQYDKEYVKTWREKAITKLEDIKIGMEIWATYFSSENAEKPLIVTALVLNIPCEDNNNQFPEWLYCKQDYNSFRLRLSDNNVTASYSPWLLFSTKELCDEYRKGLILS